MELTTTPTEAQILERVFAGRAASWSPNVARALLTLGFDGSTTTKIRRLLQKKNRGTISAAQRLTLDRYLRVGQLIDLLHARARLSLKESGTRR
jgi:hypothetical protein